MVALYERVDGVTVARDFNEILPATVANKYTDCKVVFADWKYQSTRLPMLSNCGRADQGSARSDNELMGP